MSEERVEVSVCWDDAYTHTDDCEHYHYYYCTRSTQAPECGTKMVWVSIVSERIYLGTAPVARVEPASRQGILGELRSPQTGSRAYSRRVNVERQGLWDYPARPPVAQERKVEGPIVVAPFFFLGFYSCLYCRALNISYIRYIFFRPCLRYQASII